MHKYMNIYVCKNTYVYIHPYINTNKSWREYIYMYMNMGIYIYRYMYIYIYIYTYI